jgi:cytochrome P450
MFRMETATPANVPHERVVDVDMYNPPGIEDGYHEAWKRLQKPGTPELVWTPHNGGHWIATSGALIGEIYRTPEFYSSQVIFLPKEAGEKYDLILTRMDPPQHTPFREVLEKGLGPREIRHVRDSVRAAAAELVEALAGKGRCDFSADYAQIFPIRVFMTMADLPMDDVPMLKQLATQMTRPAGDTPAEKADSLDRANKGFFEYLAPVLAARRGGNGTDILSTMINSQVGDRPMSEDEALRLTALLLLAGLDTVVNFLSFFMIHLANHPDQVQELADAPDRINRGVEELFRRFPVVAEARMVAKEHERDGVLLKHGDMILLPTALAGLDEALNADPLAVDFKRAHPRHTTFGDGPHRCAGLHLARLEVTVTLEEWLKRIPRFRMKAGEKPVYHSGIVAAIDNVQLEWDVQ